MNAQPLPSSPIALQRLLSWACAALLLTAATSPGQYRIQDLPELRVPGTTDTITVNGKLDEPCWQKAARVTLTDPWNQTDHRLEPTEVLVLHTAEALYIAFLAQDEEIRVRHKERDERTHKDDCVEVFLGRPRETLGEALGLEINANAVVADFFYRHPSWLNYGWEPETIKIISSRDPAIKITGAAPAPGYCVEIEIPWKELLYALPEREIPTRLRANFARWNYGSNGRIFTIWSDPMLTKPGPNRPERYGWLIFE